MKEWKIKGNMNKFLVVPSPEEKPMNSEQKDKEQIIKRQLGFKFKRSGYPRGIEHLPKRDSVHMAKLKRFKAVKAMTRVHLYKHLQYYQLCNICHFQLILHPKLDLKLSKQSRIEHLDKHITTKKKQIETGRKKRGQKQTPYEI